MRKVRTIVIGLLLVSVCVGCSDHLYGLKDYQKTNMRDWIAAGNEVVEEKKPETATVLGFFIGLGSFYTDEPVLPCGGLRYILLESSLRVQYVDRTRLPLNSWELDDGGCLYTAPLEKTR